MYEGSQWCVSFFPSIESSGVIGVGHQKSYKCEDQKSQVSRKHSSLSIQS